jgi:hypothetical protein
VMTDDGGPDDAGTAESDADSSTAMAYRD